MLYIAFLSQFSILLYLLNVLMPLWRKGAQIYNLLHIYQMTLFALCCYYY